MKSNKGIAETVILVFLLGGIFGFTVARATDKDCQQQQTIVAERVDDETKSR